MYTFKIPKVGIIDLIKNDNYSYYDYSEYIQLSVIMVEGCFKYDCEVNILYLSKEDLALLLFDRVVCNDTLTVIVV